MARLGEDGNGLASMDAGKVLGTMTTFAAARYAVVMKRMEGKKELSWGRLREFCGDLTALRRGEYLTRRLELEREAMGQTRMENRGSRMAGGKAEG